MSFGKKSGQGTEKPAQPVMQKPQEAAKPNMPTAVETAAVQKPQSPATSAEAAMKTQQRVESLAPMASDLKAKASQMEKEVTNYITFLDPRLINEDFKKAKTEVIETFLETVDFNTIDRLPPELKKEKINKTTESLISGISMPLNSAQHDLLKKEVLDEILGFGPLEPLLKDPDVSDIMINTHRTIYIEKNGKLARCDITFTSEKHLISVIQKIVSLVGRRVDETSPMVDARMPDGSRFNAIVPPIALDGSLVSIRKFKKNKMPLRDYVKLGSMTEQMCRFLEVCGLIRLNVIISGGTGSGKTTMLNALSGHIDEGERVVTIEDAAELQLHQPHVLRLETRPPNIEGAGEITQRMLVKNALRMRPDRIILGEIRGDEVIDVLAAMNTGHDGSMATIHANNPRDCMSRIENLVAMSGVTVPLGALRMQIASALNLVVQVARMRDGKRRVTHIEEVVGMEGDIITTQTIFSYKVKSVDDNGMLQGEYVCESVRPRLYEKSIYFDKHRELDDILGFNKQQRV